MLTINNVYILIGIFTLKYLPIILNINKNIIPNSKDLTNHLNTFIISPLNIPYSQDISMVIVTLILSYFTLVFGELVPKRIALKKSEKIALFSARPIYILSKIAKPFIKLLSYSTLLVLKITGNNNDDINEKVSEEEIRTLIAQSQEDGCIEHAEKEMIEGVFSFNDKMAREIMTPINYVFAVDLDDNLDDILESVINCNYSRIPAYKDSIDNIVGILYVKDLLNEAKKVGFDKVNLLEDGHFIESDLLTPWS